MEGIIVFMPVHNAIIVATILIVDDHCINKINNEVTFLREAITHCGFVLPVILTGSPL